VLTINAPSPAAPDAEQQGTFDGHPDGSTKVNVKLSPHDSLATQAAALETPNFLSNGAVTLS
jgi:hypothetical protein